VADLLEVLARAVTELQQRIGDIDRRIDNMITPGKVTDVDTKKQLYRQETRDKDGKITESPWIPYSQSAGEYKSHRPPTKGQQMMMISPNGEWRQAFGVPYTWSDDNKSPSDKEDEHVHEYGKLKITEKKDGGYDIDVDGGAKFSITKDKITIKSTDIVLEGQIKLGGEGASRELALKDSTTETGGPVNGNLSTSVKAT
jgi:phage baseplate assembly protein V